MSNIQRSKSFYLPKTMANDIYKLAGKKNTSSSEVVRIAIESFLKNDDVNDILSFTGWMRGKQESITYYIPNGLGDDIDNKAKQLDMSTSQLVRKIIGYIISKESKNP